MDAKIKKAAKILLQLFCGTTSSALPPLKTNKQRYSHTALGKKTSVFQGQLELARSL